MSEELPELFGAIVEAGRAGDLRDAETELWDRFGAECAVLVLDSAGFTRTTRARGIVHFLHLFLRMREIVAPSIESHGCLAWRSHADNLFAEFADAGSALDAALAAHLAVDEAGLMLDREEPYRVCIGIGFGRVLRAGGEGVFGDEMNLASKLGEDVAAAGETLVTERAFERLRDRGATRFEKRSVVVSGNDVTYYAARQ